jgi:hypothetical protein
MVEQDPNGKDPHEPGAKLDAGKPAIGLVLRSFPDALCAVNAIAEHGRQKYTLDGWKSVPNGLERYTDAGDRHRLKIAKGQLTDEDSGLLERAHHAWNALAALQLEIEKLKSETYGRTVIPPDLERAISGLMRGT